MSLREQAYRLIRQKIISLELKPGSAIDETSLQKELEIGRTPLREALLRLSQEQLVNIIPRRGMFVTDISISDLRQLFEVRIEMEVLAVQLAAEHGTEQHWQAMREILNTLPLPNSPNENELMIAIDEQCHQIIYEAARNKFLLNALNTWYALSLRLWYFFLREIGSMHEAISEHQVILELLEVGDGQQAAEVMTKHIETFQAEIHSAMIGKNPLQSR